MNVMMVSGASDASGANGDRAGHGRRKKSPMPRIEIKGEAKEEKKEKSGAWEQKKVTHAPNRDKRGSQGREKGTERGMGEEKSHPCPELR